jgi:hypothetical protein
MVGGLAGSTTPASGLATAHIARMTDDGDEPPPLDTKE